MIRILHFLFLYYKFVYFLCISYVFICGQVSDTSFSIFFIINTFFIIYVILGCDDQ